MQRRTLVHAAAGRHRRARRAHFVARPGAREAKLTIAVGGKNLLYYLPLTIAEQLGYFKDEGLDVDDRPTSPAARARCRRWSAAAPTWCSGAFEHTINMQVKGQRLRAFVLQGRAPQIVLGINPKTMPNFKAVADLKGKKIGVTAPGSSHQRGRQFRPRARPALKPSDVSHHRRRRAAAARWRRCARARSTPSATSTR